MKSKKPEGKRIINMQDSEYVENLNVNSGDTNIGNNYKIGDVGQGANVVQGDQSSISSTGVKQAEQAVNLIRELELFINGSSMNEVEKRKAAQFIDQIKKAI